MKSDKKLKKIFDEAKKGECIYYDFDRFKEDVKNFLKDIKKNQVVTSMKVSRGGMTRHFNTNGYNMLLNVCYNQKRSNDPVKVGGCGMDMMWHLFFRTCEMVGTKGENGEHFLNSKCSSQILL